ncbi:diguanylate cyclase [Oscillatoria sp. FACHB-1406]|uniref:diguanylate cyclase domain-containing protein n=1 Tax=Oscillatoria sp. FACHB-1406 TaxID=2692846 RepID=UPI0016843168|nr:diguanylate cyclase [Oscillatoria sp. FACHB-1406]MBD2576273.1 diguanylate cyclase [Oscillatoria sp. FACHB-1406]
MDNTNSEESEKPLLENARSLQEKIKQLEAKNCLLRSALDTQISRNLVLSTSLALVTESLQNEIAKRESSERSLRNLIENISKQKEDLEILIQILVDHADSLDIQWHQKVMYATHLAAIDSLTQLYNRRGFEECLNQQWNVHLTQQHSLALLMFDIDYFKQYNDTYGHIAGDECLKTIARLFREIFDTHCYFTARYGGEEFAAILPHAELPEAIAIAELLQSEVAKLQLPHLGSLCQSYVTISIGVIAATPTPELSPLMLLQEVDRLLYQAKQNGRNRITFPEDGIATE